MRTVSNLCCHWSHLTVMRKKKILWPSIQKSCNDFVNKDKICLQDLGNDHETSWKAPQFVCRCWSNPKWSQLHWRRQTLPNDSTGCSQFSVGRSQIVVEFESLKARHALVEVAQAAQDALDANTTNQLTAAVARVERSNWVMLLLRSDHRVWKDWKSVFCLQNCSKMCLHCTMHFMSKNLLCDWCAKVPKFAHGFLKHTGPQKQSRLTTMTKQGEPCSTEDELCSTNGPHCGLQAHRGVRLELVVTQQCAYWPVAK